jgi:hypothetical protein
VRWDDNIRVCCKKLGWKNLHCIRIRIGSSGQHLGVVIQECGEVNLNLILKGRFNLRFLTIIASSAVKWGLEISSFLVCLVRSF